VRDIAADPDSRTAQNGVRNKRRAVKTQRINAITHSIERPAMSGPNPEHIRHAQLMSRSCDHLGGPTGCAQMAV